MRKSLSSTFLAAALVLAPTFTYAQEKIDTYEIRNACKVIANLRAPADAPAEIEIRINDEANPQHGFGSFKKLVREGDLLVPLMGFNLCDSYKYGPVTVVLQTAGDYQKILMTCGGTWDAIAGEASMTIERSTRKVVQARVRLDGAYGNGILHSGIIKSILESFTCDNAEYAKSIAPLFDGQAVQTVKGVVVRGVFTKTP